ncbi:hypothetical protein BKA69DRAFT_1066003 [Paraphysoderma sedebokerense]|nr:hypothetical protein BKA69DRAFT_1066003 [Paraphysoderma sedebokerense]
MAHRYSNASRQSNAQSGAASVNAPAILQDMLRGIKDSVDTIQQALENSIDAAVELADVDLDEQVTEMEAAVKEYILMLAKLKAQQKVVTHIKETVTQDSQAVQNVSQYFEEKLGPEYETIKSSGSQLYANHADYKKFKKNVWEAKNPGESYREEGDREDDDLVVVGTQQSLNCPILGSRITDPVKSDICGHTFSRAGIYGLFDTSADRGYVECPISGCNRKFTKSSLKTDRDMVRMLRRLDTQDLIQDEDDDYVTVGRT